MTNDCQWLSMIGHWPSLPSALFPTYSQRYAMRRWFIKQFEDDHNLVRAILLIEKMLPRYIVERNSQGVCAWGFQPWWRPWLWKFKPIPSPSLPDCLSPRPSWVRISLQLSYPNKMPPSSFSGPVTHGHPSLMTFWEHKAMRAVRIATIAIVAVM